MPQAWLEPPQSRSTAAPLAPAAAQPWTSRPPELGVAYGAALPRGAPGAAAGRGARCQPRKLLIVVLLFLLLRSPRPAAPAPAAAAAAEARALAAPAPAAPPAPPAAVQLRLCLCQGGHRPLVLLILALVLLRHARLGEGRVLRRRTDGGRRQGG